MKDIYIEQKYQRDEVCRYVVNKIESDGESMVEYIGSQENVVVMGTKDGFAEQYQLIDSQLILQNQQNMFMDSQITCIDIDLELNLILVADIQGNLKLYEANSQKLLKEYKNVQQKINKAYLNQYNKSHLVFCYKDVKVMGTLSDKVIKIFEGHHGLTVDIIVY